MRILQKYIRVFQVWRESHWCRSDFYRKNHNLSFWSFVTFLTRKACFSCSDSLDTLSFRYKNKKKITKWNRNLYVTLGKPELQNHRHRKLLQYILVESLFLSHVYLFPSHVFLIYFFSIILFPFPSAMLSWQKQILKFTLECILNFT